MANDATAPAWATGMEERLIQATKNEIAPIKEKLGEVDTRLGKVETKQDEFEKRLVSLEQGGQTPNATFKPSFVDIKGFCDYKDRKTKGVDRPEASKLVLMLKDSLPDDLKQYVGDINLTGIKSFSIRVHLTPSHAREIVICWKDKLEQLIGFSDEAKAQAALAKFRRK